jgi:hypothetical protein
MKPTQGGDNRGQKIHAKNENGISDHRHCSTEPGFCQIIGGPCADRLSSNAMVLELAVLSFGDK